MSGSHYEMLLGLYDKPIITWVFVITRSISPRPISDIGQTLGPIFESRADKSADKEKSM